MKEKVEHFWVLFYAIHLIDNIFLNVISVVAKYLIFLSNTSTIFHKSGLNRQIFVKPSA